MAQSTCTIALTYLELAAAGMGIGACWAGYLNAAANSFAPLTEKLPLPENHRCYGAMMIGYPRYGYHRLLLYYTGFMDLLIIRARKPRPYICAF